MKTKVASLLVVVLLSTTQCMAQRNITVEAQNDDISNNLDLQAVASIFGEAKDLQDFEMQLNDYDRQISNLDLNNDGEVDYLRVIETSENNIHLVVIQAVLDKDVFQDVASIVVEKNQYRKTSVQVIGDPYLYGDNYIIEPVYVYTPSIFSFFWGNAYQSWVSPYYWGYYPTYYRNRHPFGINVYLSNIYSHINHRHHYYYTDRRRNDRTVQIHNKLSRNDFGKRYPERTFTNRNGNARNKQDFKSNRTSNDRAIQTRTNFERSDELNKGTRSTRESTNENRNTNVNERNSSTRTTPTTPSTRNSETNRKPETRQTPSTNTESRNSRTVTPDNSNRSAPAVNQSRRSSESKPAEQRTPNSQTERGSRSSETNSNRR